VATPIIPDSAHPAHIHEGQCPSPGAIKQNLNDVVQGTDEAVGQATAIPVEISETKVAMSLTDILKGQFSIVVHHSADDMGTYLVCGDIGGRMLGTTDLGIALVPVNGSGYRGAALLHDNGDSSTQVTVLLLVDSVMGAPTASGAPSHSMAPASMAPASPALPSMAPASLAPGPSPAAS
jgi:hypothetical protein